MVFSIKKLSLLNNKVFIYCLMIVSLYSKGQNLVRNHSFELLEDTSHWQYDGIADFNGSVKDWYTWNTADVFHPNPTQYSVPSTGFTYAYAQHGLVYGGTRVYDQYHGEWAREYVFSYLKSTMKPCGRYKVSFWVQGSPGQCGNLTDDFGVHFFRDTSDFIWSSNVSLVPFHVRRPEGAIISDTLNWTKIEGYYFANGSEHGIWVGNFLPDNQTTLEYIGPGREIQAYMIFDNFSVVEDTSQTISVIPDTTFRCSNDLTWHSTIFYDSLYVNGILKNELEFSDEGWYFLDFYINGCHFEDSTYFVEKYCPELYELLIPNVFTPNNDGYNDFFEILHVHSELKIEVFNRWGNLVFKSDNYQNDWNGNGLSTGQYMYLIVHDQKTYRGYFTLLR